MSNRHADPEGLGIASLVIASIVSLLTLALIDGRPDLDQFFGGRFGARTLLGLIGAPLLGVLSALMTAQGRKSADGRLWPVRAFVGCGGGAAAAFAFPHGEWGIVHATALALASTMMLIVGWASRSH